MPELHEEVIEMIEAGDFMVEPLAAIHRAILKARGLPYAGVEAQYSTVVTSIEQGKMDDGLLVLTNVIERRQRSLDRSDNNEDSEAKFRVGQDVKIVGKLRPNYLFGMTFPVVKVNDKTVCIDVPNDPVYRRFSGQKGLRIPKTAVEVVA